MDVLVVLNNFDRRVFGGFGYVGPFPCGQDDGSVFTDSWVYTVINSQGEKLSSIFGAVETLGLFVYPRVLFCSGFDFQRSVRPSQEHAGISIEK